LFPGYRNETTLKIQPEQLIIPIFTALNNTGSSIAMQFTKSILTVYCLLLTAYCFLPSCVSNKKITEAIQYDADSTKHVYSYQGKKNELIKETMFYPNGNMKSEYNFQDSVLNGTWKTFYENGKPGKEGAFLNGVENGLFKYYDMNGVLTFEGYFKNGRKEGKWTTWYDEVQKQEEREYKDDALNGTWTHWYIDGNIMKEEFYENGTKIREQNYE